VDFSALLLAEHKRCTGKKRKYARVIAKYEMIEKDQRKVMIPISAKPITRHLAADEKALRPFKALSYMIDLHIPHTNLFPHQLFSQSKICHGHK
jgi:hypothetical protein